MAFIKKHILLLQCKSLEIDFFSLVTIAVWICLLSSSQDSVVHTYSCQRRQMVLERSERSFDACLEKLSINRGGELKSQTVLFQENVTLLHTNILQRSIPPGSLQRLSVTP